MEPKEQEQLDLCICGHKIGFHYFKGVLGGCQHCTCGKFGHTCEPASQPQGIRLTDRDNHEYKMDYSPPATEGQRKETLVKCNCCDKEWFEHSVPVATELTAEDIGHIIDCIRQTTTEWSSFDREELIAKVRGLKC